MSEVLAIGLPLVGAGLWLKYLPNRAAMWYLLAAWAESNGDAAMRRRESRERMMREARERAA